MPRYAAFLRGMNLGGRRITNDALRRHLEDLGLREVSVFRASGNVVFEAARAGEQKLQARIESGLAKALSYEVPAFIRTVAHVEEIAAAEPFGADRLRASKGKLQVGLLHSAPAPRATRDVLALAGRDDALAFGRRELFWLPRGGISESGVDLKEIGRLLGPMTIRTMGTICEMAAKYGRG